MVTELLEPYRGKWHIAYFDNYFSSVQLALDLLKEQILCCGTIRKDRKDLLLELGFEVPPLQRGEAKFWQCGKMTLVHWKDKRNVYGLSTFHSNTITTIPARKDETEDVQKPELFCNYNKCMGGVDRLDQLISNYNMQRKCKKWWKTVFVRLVELCICKCSCVVPSQKPRETKEEEYAKNIS